MKKYIFFMLAFLAVIPCIAQKKSFPKMNPVDKMDPSAQIDLVIELPFRNEELLERKLHDVYDPTSPAYRQFMTPATFNEQFAPSQNDFNQILKFAKDNELKVVYAPANHAHLHVQAPAKIIEKVFKVKMMMYKNPKTNLMYYAAENKPTIRLDTKIYQITGFSNYDQSFPQKSGIIMPLKKDVVAKKDVAGSAPGGALMGNDFRNAYVPGVTLDGAGQTVGIVSTSDFSSLDVNLYELRAGRTDVPIRKIYIDGLKEFINPPPPRSGFDPNTEVSLDIEMVISMAPACNITVYGIPYGQPIVDIINEIANPSRGEPLPHQVTTSFNLNYGGDDSPRIYKGYMQMGLQGQSFFAYSGDKGSFGDLVNGGVLPFSPGDFPYVTSVGGTNLTMSGNGVAYAGEMAWGGSGGGLSPYFHMPAYQIGLHTSTNQASTVWRNVPDVSMPASNVFVVSNGGVNSNVAGTSAATPLWAGFLALVNQQAALHNLPPVGFINPAIYTIGHLAAYTDCFHDIITGGNQQAGGPTDHYQAVEGYDLVTGWGSPRGMNLINSLALHKPIPLQASLDYFHFSTRGCDPGPVAGSNATYHVRVNFGTGPYIYAWTSNNVSFVSGNSSNSATAVISVPPVGTDGFISVSVTDALGTTVTVGRKVNGIDADQAVRQISFCQFANELMYNFIPPHFVDPGDPWLQPFHEDQSIRYTPVQIHTMQEQLTRMQLVLKNMEQKK